MSRDTMPWQIVLSSLLSSKYYYLLFYINTLDDILFFRDTIEKKRTNSQGIDPDS
jgi:hypothetical protein